MSRARIVSLIIVLLLANSLVFGNIVRLLTVAGTEAATRATTPRTPFPAFTPSATDMPSPAPTVTPTAPPTPTAAPTATPTTTGTPTATPTRALSSYPTYAPVGKGTPLKYPFVYAVKSGDTISGLADTFNVPKAKILAANGLTDANFIRVGQLLLIPDPNQ
ncbi:MAG: LysM domain-containing protein [Chloroflexota bacterium]